tara:strand:+ start:5175 stop:6611 length:1437 start_codon:yes stop_codon:yes gene_type:complete
MFSHKNDSTPYDELVEKWSPLLDHESLSEISDYHRKRCTAVLLENQQDALREQYLTEQPSNSMGGGFATGQVGAAGNLAGYDPILISLVRRAMPNLMAYDLCGVQPMTAPTGLIFALRSKYGPADATNGFSGAGATEALFQEANPFAGVTQGTTVAGASAAPFDASGNIANLLTGATSSAAGTPLRDFRGMTTTVAEGLGGSGTNKAFADMGFSIDRIAVEAKTKALKAEYSTELAQDLKAVHGLDAETELANILSTEILSEINREVIRTLYTNAKLGAGQDDIAVKGVYDLYADSDGRWSAERFRGLMFQIEREANQIAKETRRGKGNFVLCTADVASALAMGGFLNISPAMNVALDPDDTGNTFVGTLNGKFKVYVDPYAAGSVGAGHAFGDYAVVGYKGTNPYDAGFFYCPYVPLQMVRAVDHNTFQPKIGFKTRYGMVANPFAENTVLGTLGGNQYYRIMAVKNLHGFAAGGTI